MRRRSLSVLVVVSALAGALPVGAQTVLDVHRTVYVTATDEDGNAILDLTAADLTVREDGESRRILDVAPSTEPLMIALAIDELLAPYMLVRQAALQFVQRLNRHGRIALYLVGLQNETKVEYTSDVAPFWNAVNAFPIRPRDAGNLVEALREIARAQLSLEGRRVIVALAPEMAQVSSVTADAVLDELRDTGAVFYAVTIATANDAQPVLEENPATRLMGGDLTQQVERDIVLGDGPRQSGGLRISSTGVDAFTTALDRIAGELLHQYAVTYVVPSGTESDGSLRIEADRPGLTIRGPRRVPEL